MIMTGEWVTKCWERRHELWVNWTTSRRPCLFCYCKYLTRTSLSINRIFYYVKFSGIPSRTKLTIGSLSTQRFWATDGNRKCAVSVFNSSSHYHIYIFKYLFTSRDDYFENLRETTALACEMFTSGCRPWLKNVACLSSLITLSHQWWFNFYPRMCHIMFDVL